MSLVAYASSDEAESEDEDAQVQVQVQAEAEANHGHGAAAGSSNIGLPCSTVTLSNSGLDISEFNISDDEVEGDATSYNNINNNNNTLSSLFKSLPPPKVNDFVGGNEEEEEVIKDDGPQSKRIKFAAHDFDEEVGPAKSRGRTSLFDKLPPPRNNFPTVATIRSEAVSDSNWKEAKPVKIMVPALSSFDADITDLDDDMRVAKTPKKSMDTVGLFAILPPPKNSLTGATKVANRLLVPHAVSKKQKNPAVSHSAIKTGPLKPTQKPSLIPYSQNDDSEDDEDGNVGCFFSLDGNDDGKAPSYSFVPLPSVTPNPNDVSVELLTGSVGISDDPLPFNESWVEQLQSSNEAYPATASSSSSSSETYNPKYYQYNDDTRPSIGPDPQPDKPSNLLDLDDEVLRRLQGKRREEINIIDVAAADQLPPRDDWQIKNMTEEKVTYSHRKKTHMPTSQQRRKHQITYLAFQAKERELELKNQWAQNRLTKRQTQSKYGF